MRHRTNIPSDPGLLPTELHNERGPYVGQPARTPIRRFFHEPDLDRIFLDLYSAFGPQHWWPARTPFEVIVGAILTQNTAWRNVELALAQLRLRIPLTPGHLLAMTRPELEDAVRPSGTFRAKATKLVSISSWYLDVGGLETLRSAPLEPIRRELLGVHGVGPETADSILCYAAGRRTAVVDTYTRRLLERHGFCSAGLPYESLRTFLQSRLLHSQRVFEEFHAICVRVGYDHCKPSPHCESCAAAATLPSGEGNAWGGFAHTPGARLADT